MWGQLLEALQVFIPSDLVTHIQESIPGKQLGMEMEAYAEDAHKDTATVTETIL